MRRFVIKSTQSEKFHQGIFRGARAQFFTLVPHESGQTSFLAAPYGIQ